MDGISGSNGTVNGGGGTINLVGDNNTVTSSGGVDNIWGNGEHVTDSGTATTVAVVGNPGTATVSGAGDAVTFWGNSDSITDTGGTGTLGIVGDSGSITASGTGGVTTLWGSSGHITLNGTGEIGRVLSGGSDTITVNGTGNSARDRGTGNSTIALGGSGNTAFLFGAHDTLTDTGSGNQAILEVASESATLTGTNGAVQFSGASDSATLAGTGNTVFLETSNGSVTVTGTDSAVVDEGTAGGNRITVGSASGTGATAISSIAGAADTYQLVQNFGQVNITGTGAASRVFFGVGVTLQNLWFAQMGGNLVVSLLGTSENVTLAGWFTTGADVQSFILADGHNLGAAQVAGLVSSMANYAGANPSFDPTVATQLPNDSTLQAALSASWVAQTGITDTAANVNSQLDSLQTLAANGGLAFITLLDAGTPTLAITSAQFALDTGALAAITGPYSLTVSSVTASFAPTVAANAHVTSIAVVDSATNVASHLDALQANALLTSITLTGTGTQTLSVTAAQLAADAGALALIAGAYNLAVSGVSVANAASTAAQTHVTTVSVSDTGANVAGAIDALQALGTKLTGITLTDGATPTLAITALQLTADAGALGKIASAYNLSVSGVLAANVATVAANTHVTAMTVADTGANVAANLNTLQAQTKLAAITLTDASTPTLAITSAQLSSDAGVLGKIASAYNLAVSAVTVANAVSTSNAAHVTSISVTDTSANLGGANLDTLQSLAASGKLASVTVSNNTTAVAMTFAQFTNDAGALGLFAGTYSFSVSGVTAAGLASVTANAHATSLTVSDTGANVASAIDTLQGLGAKLSSISLTDTGTPTLSITSAQFTNDSATLGRIGRVQSGDFRRDGGKLLRHIPPAERGFPQRSDTAANVAAGIDTLQAVGAKLSSVVLTTSGTPTLSITSTQLSADAGALGKITGAYNLSVSGVTMAGQAAILSQPHVAWSASPTPLQTWAAQTSIRSRRWRRRESRERNGDDRLSHRDDLRADDERCDSAGTVHGNVFPVGVGRARGKRYGSRGEYACDLITVSDIAANVASAIDTLQGLGTKLTSIALTNGGTPVLSITGTQFTADATAIAKITSAYSLSVSSVLAANSATVFANTHVTAMTIVDTGANVATNLNTLQTDNAKITSITLTDGSTPTLAITATQFSSDAGALGKIVSAYNLAVSAVTVANAVSTSNAAHVTSISVTDTAANLAARTSIRCRP